MKKTIDSEWKFDNFRSSYPDREDAEEDKDGEVDDGDDSEDEIEIVSLNQDGYELVLPSGKYLCVFLLGNGGRRLPPFPPPIYVYGLICLYKCL